MNDILRLWLLNYETFLFIVYLKYQIYLSFIFVSVCLYFRNPNLKETEEDTYISWPKWPEYEPTKKEYIILNQNAEDGSSFDKHENVLRPKKCAFWNQFLPLVEQWGGNYDSFLFFIFLKIKLGPVALQPVS